MAQEQSIFTIISAVYIFGKIFGMAPYTKKPRQRGYTNTNRVNVTGCCNLGIILLMCSLMIYCFAQMIILRQQEKFYNQLNTVVCVLQTMRLISAVITMLSFYFTQDAFIFAIEKLHDFDQKKKQFGTAKYDLFRNVTFFFISIAFSLIITVELLYYTIMKEKISIIILDTFSNGIQLLIHLFALVYFQLYVIILIDNFKFLKTTAETYNNSFPKSPKQMIHVIKTISSMYDDSCKGAGSINQVFSFPLFSLVSLNFMEILLGVYALTNVSTRNFTFMYWTMFHGVQLMFILIPAGTVEGYANDVSKYLAEANLGEDENVLKQRDHFLLRTLQQSIDFTACGFFPITTSAIVGQFSISISFLLFMFQIIK